MMRPSLLLQAGEIPSVARTEIVSIAVLYFVVCAGIAVWATRRTKTASDFFVAGSGVGLWTLAIAAMASTLSGFAFIGGPGLVYTLGIGAVFIVLSASITNSLGAWVLAKRVRLLGEIRGLMTIPDAIGARYRSPAAHGLSAVAILIATVGYLATNLLAFGLVIRAIFGLGLTESIWVGMAVVMAYSVAGGILAGVYTDLFQGATMALASVLVFWRALDSGDGLAAMSQTILTADPEWFGPWGHLPAIAALSFFFVFGIGSLGQPHVIHKFYMLRDPKRLRWYPLLMTGALLLALLLYFGVGLAMKAAVLRGDVAPLTQPDDATPFFLIRYVSPLVAGIVFSGVAAAIMSSVNSFMSIGAAVITHDLPVAFGRKLRNELTVGRITTVGLAIVSTIIAAGSGQMVALLGVFGWGLYASTIVPALALGLNWRGATRAGAIASIATGLSVTLVAELAVWFKFWSPPAGVTASGLALLLSLVVFFVVSRLTRETASGQLDPDVALVMET